MGVIAAAGCDDKLRWRCWSLSFVHVSGLPIISSNRNGVFERYLGFIDVILIFHPIGGIRFMAWCFEH
jgi:hypothetical protein